MNDKKSLPVLSINNFSLSFMMNSKNAYALKDISLHIKEGEMVALVGESGCGKTMTALSCMGLQPENAVISGSIKLSDNDILKFSRKEWNSFRGKDISMIFQEPMTSLNPLEKVGKQIEVTGILHGMNKADAQKKALSLMEQVNIENPHQLYNSYPHQLSGGQRQRIMIASALMNSPKLLIADEPTTALDVTTQEQIMNLLLEMNKKMNTAVLLVTHDLLLVKRLCTRVYIMYAGSILESGNTSNVLGNPIHPYTKGLLGALPSAAKKNERLSTIQGVVPPINKRLENPSYLFERWPQAKDICYLNEKKSNGESHKVYCHVHKILEDV